MKVEGTGFGYGGGWQGDTKVTTKTRKIGTGEKWTPPPSPTRIRARTDEELALGREMAEASAKRRRKTSNGRGNAFRRISEELVKQIVEDYQSGLSAKAVSEKHGISTTTTLKYLRENGIEMRGMKSPKEKVDEMVRLYEQGLSMKEIGKRVGTTNTTVRRQLMSKGITIRSQGEWRRMRREQS